MVRTSFEQLPVEGAKFPRDTSRVVNQIMNGKTNNVVDIPFTGQEVLDANFLVRVDDIRASAQSFINFVPRSLESAAQPVLVAEQGNGFFIAAFPDPGIPPIVPGDIFEYRYVVIG